LVIIPEILRKFHENFKICIINKEYYLKLKILR
jgi:hypothetical protein